MNFKVFYSPEKDIWNYLNAGWKFTYLKHGRENIREDLLKRFPQGFRQDLLAAATEEQAREVIEKLFQSRTEEYQRLTNLSIKVIQLVLDQEKENIVKLLEKTYSQPFPFSEITIYLTTFPINPYNYEERWFMVSRSAGAPEIVRLAKHELNHFMFYYYFLDDLTKQGINKERREKVKEALAILTNPEGTDKPAVKELENYIKQIADKPVKEIIELSLASGLL